MEGEGKFVYLLRADGDHYKIGIAQDVYDRMKGIQTGNAHVVELISCVWVPKARLTESQLHKWLASHKASGGTEWFKLEPLKVIELIARMTKFSITPEVSRYIDYRNLLARQSALEKTQKEFMVEAKKLLAERVEEKQANEKQSRSEADPLYDKAKEIIIRSNRGSTSFLQRRLSIGYARASKLIDLLELNGVVGPADGARPRRVILPKSLPSLSYANTP